MALKKKTTNSKEEQLYMLEVFIDKLNLNPDKVSDINTENLCVCVNFADLAPYEIKPEKNKNQTNDNENSKSTCAPIDFKCGKSCLFAKTPNALVKNMRSTPLRTQLYSEESICPSKRNRVPLCMAKISLPGCMCDHVIAARNEINGTPTPCTAKNTFDLTDSEGGVWATISIVLRLSCFGCSIVKHFSLNDKSFVIEDSPLAEKFVCFNSVTNSAEGDGQSKDSKSLLKRPDSPPRVSMDEPGFEDLTTAEKLNDPKYRELIYKAYPNEPTCCCLPRNLPVHPLMCPSGCTRSCCMKLRDPKLLLANDQKTPDDLLPITYCVNDLQAGIPLTEHDARCGNLTRLRGGADVEQIYVGHTGRTWTDYDMDYNWFDDKINAENRLEGGGGDRGKSSCACSGGAGTVPVRRSASAGKEGDASLNVQDACKPRMRADAPTPGCVCPGKETSTWMRGSAKCTKKPCQGVDCLIRAFKDAQDFVDSIGKVPGLAGLGLMDPSESPYFGREPDKEYAPEEGPIERRRGQSGFSQSGGPSSQCAAPCNVGQTGKPIGPGESVHAYVPAIPLTIAVPGRTGIVREAVPTLPDSSAVAASTKQKKKDEKKEEKIEKQKELDVTSSAQSDGDIGPCGEPRCRSRRKRALDSLSLSNQQNAHPQVSDLQLKKSSVQRDTRIHYPPTMAKNSGADRRFNRGRPEQGQQAVQRGIRGEQRSKQSVMGPGGDRSNTIGRTSVKVSRRVMRYVYSLGDAYPGIVYGHKNCIDPRMRVPANMGWLWNTTAIAGKLKPRLGWKPGAIGRYLYEMLKEAKAGSSLQEAAASASNRPRSVPSRTKKGKVYKTMSFTSSKKMQAKKEGEDEVEAPPTLHIHRRDGTYYVTMYPIKQETDDVPRLSEPMKPLQFKIVKNKDDGSVASSSTASDMEIEFSPPAAVTRYQKKPDVIHVDTQVRQQEILDAVKPADALKKREKKSRREKKGKTTDVKK